MSEPIRILHVSGAMNRGGQETLIMELYRHIDRSKVQFDFLLYNYSGKPGAYDEEIKQLGGKIYEAKRKFYNGPIRFMRELDSFFKSHSEYKVVHSHQYKVSGFVLSAAKKNNKLSTTIAHSHIANIHSEKNAANYLRIIQSRVGEHLIKKHADFCFGCADDAIVQLIGEHADGRTKFVLNNAIEPKKFLFNGENREKWRKNFGASDDTLIIGNIARFTYQKNHEKTIRIFSEICKRKEDSLLVLVGTGSGENEIQKLAKEYGILERVIFMGSRSDVNEIINAFDVFLFPSRYEGLGIVLIEAQANGLPCVISKDVIPNEADINCGLITRVDLSDSAENWADVCLHNQGRLESERAIRAVRESHYDINDVAKWLEDFYLDKYKKNERTVNS